MFTSKNIFQPKIFFSAAMKCCHRLEQVHRCILQELLTKNDLLENSRCTVKKPREAQVSVPPHPGKRKERTCWWSSHDFCRTKVGCHNTDDLYTESMRRTCEHHSNVTKSTDCDFKKTDNFMKLMWIIFSWKLQKYEISLNSCKSPHARKHLNSQCFGGFFPPRNQEFHKFSGILYFH